MALLWRHLSVCELAPYLTACRLVHERVLELPVEEGGDVLPYSTVWEHARKIRSRCGPFVIEQSGDRFRAVVGVVQKSGECLAAESWGTTRPLALCRAALISALAAESS